MRFLGMLARAGRTPRLGREEGENLGLGMATGGWRCLCCVSITFCTEGDGRAGGFSCQNPDEVDPHLFFFWWPGRVRRDASRGGSSPAGSSLAMSMISSGDVQKLPPLPQCLHVSKGYTRLVHGPPVGGICACKMKVVFGFSYLDLYSILC